jgi:peroxiredoxin
VSRRRARTFSTCLFVSGSSFHKENHMKVRLAVALLVAGFALACAAVYAEDLKSGPTDRIAGPFDVRAITGEHRKGDKKEELCYVCKYSAQARPAVVLIFTQKADENLAKVVKAVDEVQKNNKDLGTVVVGVSGVSDADFEKLQETQKLAAPLTIAVEKDGPSKYELNKDAAVTVLVYEKGGKIKKNFAFKDTKAAAEKAKEIADTAKDLLPK